MQWPRFVALLFLLLYFWYMTGSREPRVAPPATQLNRTDPDNFYTFKETGSGYQCMFNHNIWNTDIPDGFVFRTRDIRRKDPCDAVRDHGKVLATGNMLYEYLQKERLQSSPRGPVEIDASTAFQDPKIFYFECLNNAILQLHPCPSGHVFRHNECLPVSVCLDQPDGTTFPDPFDTLAYYQCARSKLERKRCAPDTFFQHDRCKGTDVQYFCRHNAFQMLDERTLLVCHRGRATFETCPLGFRYFENPLASVKPVCESEQCVHIPNDRKLPLPVQMENGFEYTPGYVTCRDDRVRDTVMCPREWDTFLSDHQLPLPQVFDTTLQACTIPQFCENVVSQDPDTIVPVYEWTKYLPQWKYSTTMDRVTGFKCVAGKRIRTVLPLGHRIGRHMKTESACQDKAITAVPVPNDASKFYDCATGQVKSCGIQGFFNGKRCQMFVKNAFQFFGIDIFKVHSLDDDSWIKPWAYLSPTDTLKQDCQGDFIYNELYHICSHKDCVLYPYLSQIDFSIGLRDGSTCEYDKSKRYLNKIDPVSKEKYFYWSQRTTHDASPQDIDSEPCQKGQFIRSGQFPYDRTIFATCDPKQPFVFCPSPLTEGIEELNGIFTCKLSTQIGTTTMLPRKKRSFVRSEIYRIISSTATQVKINNQLRDVKANTPLYLAPYSLDASPYTTQIETTNAEVKLYFNFRVSHPPHLARVYKKVMTIESDVDGTGYIFTSRRFTSKALNFPFYKYEPIVPDFTI